MYPLLAAKSLLPFGTSRLCAVAMAVVALPHSAPANAEDADSFTASFAELSDALIDGGSALAGATGQTPIDAASVQASDDASAIGSPAMPYPVDEAFYLPFISLGNAPDAPPASAASMTGELPAIARETAPPPLPVRAEQSDGADTADFTAALAQVPAADPSRSSPTWRGRWTGTTGSRGWRATPSG